MNTRRGVRQAPQVAVGVTTQDVIPGFRGIPDWGAWVVRRGGDRPGILGDSGTRTHGYIWGPRMGERRGGRSGEHSARPLRDGQ